MRRLRNRQHFLAVRLIDDSSRRKSREGEINSNLAVAGFGAAGFIRKCGILHLPGTTLMAIPLRLRAIATARRVHARPFGPFRPSLGREGLRGCGRPFRNAFSRRPEIR